jgi:hypothetical protein
VFAEVATELELELANNVELFNRAGTRPHADRAQYDALRVWRQLDVSAVTERVREFLLGFVAGLARSLPADMQEQLDGPFAVDRKRLPARVDGDGVDESESMA